MGLLDDLFINEFSNHRKIRDLRSAQDRARRRRNRASLRQRETDERQDERMAELEAQNETLFLYVTRLGGLLAEKGLVSQEELRDLARAIDDETEAEPEEAEPDA